MATHSSILAWRIPWTEEPGGLYSMGSQGVRRDCSDLALAKQTNKNNQNMGKIQYRNFSKEYTQMAKWTGKDAQHPHKVNPNQNHNITSD